MCTNSKRKYRLCACSNRRLARLLNRRIRRKKRLNRKCDHYGRINKPIREDAMADKDKNSSVEELWEANVLPSTKGYPSPDEASHILKAVKRERGKKEELLKKLRERSKQQT